TLVSFNDANGSYPHAELVLGDDGKFYGTTYNGGYNDNGTVFQITTGGILNTLIFFDSTNGALSHTALVFTNGFLYGTSSAGGTLEGGNAFSLNIPAASASLPGRMLPLIRAGSSWTLRLSQGSPGGMYQFQRATNLSGPWVVLTNVTAAGDGTA